MTYSNKTLGSRTIGYSIIPSENSRSTLYLYLLYYIIYEKYDPAARLENILLLLLLMANIIILYAQWYTTAVYILK